MDFTVDFKELLLLVGLFLSVIMAIAFGIKSYRRVANVWFTGFLIASAVVFIVKLLYSTGQIVDYPHWFKLNRPAGLLRPVLFYLYISYLLNSETKIKLQHFLHFLPFVLLSIYLMPFFLMDGAYKADVLYGRISSSMGIMPGWYLTFQYLYSIAYLVLVSLSLRSYVRKNPRPNRQKRVLIKWIWFMLIGSVGFILTTFLIKISGSNGLFNIYAYDVYSILLILLCIRLMTLPEVVTSNHPDSKYEKSPLSENDIVDTFSRIKALMSEKHYYKQRNLKLIHIARELGIPAYQISQVINQTTGESFADFINGFRVEEAKTILQQSYSKYTIEGIGQEAGFKSRASFYAAFKKHTNLTPSQFLKK